MGARTRTADDVLADVHDVASRLRDLDAERAELFARRLALFREARALDPPVTQKALGDAAGISEVGVIAQIRKAGANGT